MVGARNWRDEVRKHKAEYVKPVALQVGAKIKLKNPAQFSCCQEDEFIVMQTGRKKIFQSVKHGFICKLCRQTLQNGYTFLQEVNMKFIRQLKEFESKAEYLSDKYFEDYKQYFEDRRRIQYGLSKNQYFAACVDAGKGELLGLINSLAALDLDNLDKYVYVSKKIKECGEKKLIIKPIYFS